MFIFSEMKRTVLPVFCAATLLIHAAAAEKTMLSNGSVELKLQGASITSLRAGSKQIDFIKDLKPEFWHETAETRVKVDGTTAAGTRFMRHFEINPGGSAVITADELLLQQ